MSNLMYVVVLDPVDGVSEVGECLLLVDDRGHELDRHVCPHLDSSQCHTCAFMDKSHCAAGLNAVNVIDTSPLLSSRMLEGS